MIPLPTLKRISLENSFFIKGKNFCGSWILASVCNLMVLVIIRNSNYPIMWPQFHSQYFFLFPLFSFSRVQVREEGKIVRIWLTSEYKKFLRLTAVFVKVLTGCSIFFKACCKTSLQTSLQWTCKLLIC